MPERVNIVTIDELTDMRDQLDDGIEAIRRFVGRANDRDLDAIRRAEALYEEAIDIIDQTFSGPSIMIVDDKGVRAFTSDHPAAQLTCNLDEALSTPIPIPGHLLTGNERGVMSALRLYAVVRLAGYVDAERQEARLYANQAWLCRRMNLQNSTIEKAAATLREARCMETRRGIYGRDTYEYAVKLDGTLFP